MQFSIWSLSRLVVCWLVYKIEIETEENVMCVVKKNKKKDARYTQMLNACIFCDFAKSKQKKTKKWRVSANRLSPKNIV
jgi:thiamine pyrophosphokinase